MKKRKTMSENTPNVEETLVSVKQVKDPKTRQREYRLRQKAKKNVSLDVFISEEINEKLNGLVGASDGKDKKEIVAKLIEKEFNRMYSIKNSKLKAYLEKKGGQ